MNEKLIEFIKLCLVDGIVTDKEREVIFRKSKEFGVPEDECEIILDSMIHSFNKDENQKQSKNQEGIEENTIDNNIPKKELKTIENPFKNVIRDLKQNLNDQSGLLKKEKTTIENIIDLCNNNIQEINNKNISSPFSGLEILKDFDRTIYKNITEFTDRINDTLYIDESKFIYDELGRVFFYFGKKGLDYYGSEVIFLDLIDDGYKFIENKKLFKTEYGINLGYKKENKIVLFEKERKEDLIKRFNNIKKYVKKKISLNKEKKENRKNISLHKQKLNQNKNRTSILDKNIQFLDDHKTIDHTLFGYIILKEKIQEFQSKITQFGHNYVVDLVDVSVFLENKCRSLEKMILQIKSSFNDTEHKSYLKLIDDGVKRVNKLNYYSLNFLNSIIEKDLFTYNSLRKVFDEMSVFNKKWENDMINNLTSLNTNIQNLENSIVDMTYQTIDSIRQLENSTVSKLDQIDQTTRESVNELNKSLSSKLTNIDDKLGFNNMMTSIQTYQTYKTNKNTKSLRK